MKKLIILLILSGCYISATCVEQEVRITFTGTGEATVIDRITATNLRTNLSVTFPGSATLKLLLSSGTGDIANPDNRIIVFPNPFKGHSKVAVTIGKPQKVNLSVLNLMGQVVAQHNGFLQPGINEFGFSVRGGGIYFVIVTTQEGINSSKVFNMEPSGQEDRIGPRGLTAGVEERTFPPAIESSQMEYTLDYIAGDIIHYTCFSGTMTTIVTDAAGVSKNIEVGFADCTDNDGRSYAIVKIGSHTWMAENLAYLPSVSPAGSGSRDDTHFYVSGYNGTVVSAAKEASLYSTYGVLYNWQAALVACPSGWHLASEPEWADLISFLGAGAGGLMKETGIAHWSSPNTGATNASGFTALPGGYRTLTGDFINPGEYGYFWARAGISETTAYIRKLSYTTDGADRLYLDRAYGFSVRCVKE